MGLRATAKKRSKEAGPTGMGMRGAATRRGMYFYAMVG